MAANFNYTPAHNGKSSAVCCCCGRKSRPAKLYADDLAPSLWNMARGWSEAPFPSDFVHNDGSIGSMYTCPSCNKQLSNGAELMMRGGLKQRSAA